MPAEIWTEAARMTTSGLLVGMVAVPVGLLAWAARPLGEPLLPRWKPWRVPWSGFAVIGAFFVVMQFIPVVTYLTLGKSGFYTAVYGADFPALDAKDVDPERLQEASTLRMLWTSVFSLPLVLGLLWWATRTLYPKWKVALAGVGSIAGKVALAVTAWLAVAPVVLIFNGVVNAVAQSLNVTPETHALAKLGGRPLMDQMLFAFEACVGAPLREEILFRGILLAWCVGRMKISRAGVQPVTALRSWFVMVAVLVFAVREGKTAAPVIFAGLLAVGLAVLWRYTHTGARRARAVYATAALFAVVHSSVWPNPVPLFVLGLGLGWLAVRTNGVLVPVIVHGLFNAVSVAFVLRGS